LNGKKEKPMQHEIKFTYGEVLTSNETSLTMAGGDTVTFSSDQGSVCALLVTGEGSTLRAWEYRTGDQPITLAPLTKYRFCCGVRAGEATIGWPNSDKFGGGFETTGGGGGTGM
jgi:hypothetical protein